MNPLRTILNGTTVLAVVGLFSITSSQAQTWLNETDTPGEADFVNLQFPFSINVQGGQQTPLIFGRIYEAGVTEAVGAHGSITAQIGYGPFGTDPRTDSNWLWSSANFNLQLGNDDEYMGTLTVNAGGSYSYTYRFSFDGGTSYTLGDIDGAGSNGGLGFSTSQMGTLNVEAVPEPGVTVLALLGGGLFAVRRWRRGR